MSKGSPSSFRHGIESLFEPRVGAVITAWVRDIARSEVERMEAARTEGFYRSDNALPTGTTRRTFVEMCRSGRIPDATKEGRAWVCPRGSWHSARLQRVIQSPIAKPAQIAPAEDDEQLADRLIQQAGFRKSRGR